MIKDNRIFSVIKENISDLNAVFVFQTETVAAAWADYVIENTEVKAVAMERFVAWDTFKSNSIKADVAGKRSIPSTMRDIFAASLIEQNAKDPFITKIIPVEYSSQAASFAKWIAGFLPSLQSWKEKTAGKKMDEEDEDYNAIYERYKAFLDENNLFDPAWLKPPFKSDSCHYFIFCPEILSDYSEYRQLLEAPQSKEFITVVSCSEVLEKVAVPECDFFANSREELRHVALRARYLHEQEKIPYDHMAINVPDMETYGPYICRELDLYKVPHVQHSGRPLNASGAGSLFVLLQECVQKNFSFDSVKNLLLDTELPWKEPKLNASLIRFGKDNNCLCNYTYMGKECDVWHTALSSHPHELRLQNLYMALKDHCTKIVNAKTFTEIREQYFAFKTKFFNMAAISDLSDKILARCVTTLADLIDLEKDFPHVQPSDPYSVFIQELADLKYVFQNKDRGVTILPYKMAASAPFDVHFVLDAGETSASVIYKPLSFLREDKRSELGLEDINASEKFIKLYALSSISGKAYFTCSEKTFTGYEVCHGSLEQRYCIPGKKESVEPLPVAEDFINEEKDWMLQEGEFPSVISDSQKESFERWCGAQKNILPAKARMRHGDFDQLVKMVKLADGENGKVMISPSTMNKFIQCPRRFLYERIYGVEEEVLETELVDDKFLGTLKHAIFEAFCNEAKDRILMNNEEDELYKKIDGIVEKTADEYVEKKVKTELSRVMLSSEIDSVKDEVKGAIRGFVEKYSGYTVFAAEKEFWYYPENRNYYLFGKIDCILKDQEGNFAIVDFKSSDYFKNFTYYAEDNLLPDFQIPFYVFLLENGTDAGGKKYKGTVQHAEFYDIAKGNRGIVVDAAPEDESEEDKAKRKSRTREEFEETLKWILEKEENVCDFFYGSILNSDFIVTKKNQDFNTCAGCSFKAVCRRTFTVCGEGR